MVRIYLQARQGYIQQISSLHIMDSNNVRIHIIQVRYIGSYYTVLPPFFRIDKYGGA